MATKPVKFIGLCDCGKCEPSDVYAPLDEAIFKKALYLQSRGVKLTAKPSMNREYVTFAAMNPKGGLPIAHAFCPNKAGTIEAASEMISVAYAMVTYKFKTYE